MEAWLGVLHLVRQDTETQEDFEGIAAVFCADRQGYEDVVKSVVEAQGYQLLWAEEVNPAGQWISRHPKERSAAGLARAVHHGHRIEIGTLKAVGKEGEELAELEYLSITEHEIPPLPDQSGIPFWDQDWIVSELKELLFGQPEDGLKLRTYCIINASLRKHVTKVFDLDNASIDVPIQCLFKGDAAQDLKEVAPYLLDMTLPEGALEDRDLVPSFHKDLFARHWGQNSGIFIRTPALMADVWNHFRKFTKVAMEEDGSRVFFLFHDPRILPGYLRNIAQDAGKTRCFCSDDQGISFQFVIESGADKAFAASPDMEKLAETARPRFTLSYSDFIPQAEAEKRKRAIRIAERVKDDFPEELKDQSVEDTAAFVLKITERFNAYGISKQEYMHLLVAWSIFFGEGFEEKDPQGSLKDICQSKVSEDEKFVQFKARFERFTYRPAEAG